MPSQSIGFKDSIYRPPRKQQREQQEQQEHLDKLSISQARGSLPQKTSLFEEMLIERDAINRKSVAQSYFKDGAKLNQTPQLNKSQSTLQNFAIMKPRATICNNIASATQNLIGSRSEAKFVKVRFKKLSEQHSQFQHHHQPHQHTQSSLQIQHNQSNNRTNNTATSPASSNHLGGSPIKQQRPKVASVVELFDNDEMNQQQLSYSKQPTMIKRTKMDQQSKNASACVLPSTNITSQVNNLQQQNGSVATRQRVTRKVKNDLSIFSHNNQKALTGYQAKSLAQKKAAGKQQPADGTASPVRNNSMLQNYITSQNNNFAAAALLVEQSSQEAASVLNPQIKPAVSDADSQQQKMQQQQQQMKLCSRISLSLYEQAKDTNSNSGGALSSLNHPAMNNNNRNSKNGNHNVFVARHNNQQQQSNQLFAKTAASGAAQAGSPFDNQNERLSAAEAAAMTSANLASVPLTSLSGGSLNDGLLKVQQVKSFPAQSASALASSFSAAITSKTINVGGTPNRNKESATSAMVAQDGVSNKPVEAMAHSNDLKMQHQKASFSVHGTTVLKKQENDQKSRYSKSVILNQQEDYKLPPTTSALSMTDTHDPPQAYAANATNSMMTMMIQGSQAKQRQEQGVGLFSQAAAGPFQKYDLSRTAINSSTRHNQAVAADLDFKRNRVQEIRQTVNSTELKSEIVMTSEKLPGGGDIVSKAKQRLRTHSKGKSVSQYKPNSAIDMKEIRHAYNKTSADGRLNQPHQHALRMQGVTSSTPSQAAHQSVSQNLLPESIFSQQQVNSQIIDMIQQPGGNQQNKFKPAWKQQANKSELNSARPQMQSRSNSRALNSSVDKVAGGQVKPINSGRSPYHEVVAMGQQSVSVSHSTVGGASSGGGINNQFIIQPTTFSVKRNKASFQNVASESIQNERDRIQDIMHQSSTTYGQNNLGQATAGSRAVSDDAIEKKKQQLELPHYSDSAAFSSKLQSNTSQRQNETDAISNDGESEQEAVVNDLKHNMSFSKIQSFDKDSNIRNGSDALIALPINSNKVQTQKNANMSGQSKVISSSNFSTTQPPNAAEFTFKRSNIQGSGNKYNFMTPMILSDLHQISSIHQSLPPEPTNAGHQSTSVAEDPQSNASPLSPVTSNNFSRNSQKFAQVSFQNEQKARSGGNTEQATSEQQNIGQSRGSSKQQKRPGNQAHFRPMSSNLRSKIHQPINQHQQRIKTDFKNRQVMQGGGAQTTNGNFMGDLTSLVGQHTAVNSPHPFVVASQPQRKLKTSSCISSMEQSAIASQAAFCNSENDYNLLVTITDAEKPKAEGRGQHLQEIQKRQIHNKTAVSRHLRLQQSQLDGQIHNLPMKQNALLSGDTPGFVYNTSTLGDKNRSGNQRSMAVRNNTMTPTAQTNAHQRSSLLNGTENASSDLQIPQMRQYQHQWQLEHQNEESADSDLPRFAAGASVANNEHQLVGSSQQQVKDSMSQDQQRQQQSWSNVDGGGSQIAIDSNSAENDNKNGGRKSTANTQPGKRKSRNGTKNGQNSRTGNNRKRALRSTTSKKAGISVQVASNNDNDDDRIDEAFCGSEASSQKRQRLSQSSEKSDRLVTLAPKQNSEHQSSNVSEDSQNYGWSNKSVTSSTRPMPNKESEGSIKSDDIIQPSRLQQNQKQAAAEQEESKAHEASQQSSKAQNQQEQIITEQRLKTFNEHLVEQHNVSDDPMLFSHQKVEGFLTQNPLNQKFLQKDKGRLPYSVFKPHAQQVTFLKSIFEGRPPVAFFQYPSYVGLKRVADRIRIYTREEVEHLNMSFRISDSTHIYNAVVNSCKAAGFNMIESNKSQLFNLQWTGYITANDIKQLNKYQKTNHFPGSSQLGRKDLLWRNMARMRSKFPQDFAISPRSYLIQEDYEAFLAERERDPNALWILKPVAASCGRGIKIINSTQKVSKKEGMLACKYIANPHLLNGLKYDLRVYVLVTSFNPLRVYMYNDGLVRFATEKYSNDPRKLQKKYMHLTNFSINKKNMNFVKNTDKVGMKQMRDKQAASEAGVKLEDEDQQEFDQNSSKWDFKMLRAAYEKQGINYEYVIAQFKDLIVKTLLCVEPHVTQNLQKNPTNRINCFELYGFDIIVDSNYKPWVLEVNVLPSLSSSSPFDKRIKTMLICDTLTLVGIRGYDKQKFHSQTTELLGLAPFSQSGTLSELRQKPRLTGSEALTRDELDMLMDLDEEFMRRGNFQRIFPLASNASFYEQFFETKRYQNALCACYLTSPQHIRDKLLAKHHRKVYNSQV